MPTEWHGSSAFAFSRSSLDRRTGERVSLLSSQGVPTILTGWHAEGSLNSSATCKLKNLGCGRNHLGTKELPGIAGKSCRQPKHLHFTSAVCLFWNDISTCALINSVSLSECPTYALVTRDITCCWLAASLNQFGGRAPRRSETSARRDWTIWRPGGLEERKKRRCGTRREKAISQRQIRDTYRNSSVVENEAFMAWSDQIWHLLQMK